mgnify:FL=1
MTAKFPFNDLTDLVNQAQSGLKRDVEPLVEAIPDGGFFVSLARSLDLPSAMSIPPAEAPLSTHLLKHPDGSIYVTVFTRPEFVQTVQEKEGWKTEDTAKAEVCALNARNALYYAWKLLTQTEGVVGLFINPYQEKSLLLNRREVQNLFNGTATPFAAYAERTPLQEGESIMVRPADVSSVPGFTDCVDAFIENEADLEGYEVVALFDEQRNAEPYLAINFKGEGLKPEQYQDVAQRFVTDLQSKVDFPERLEMMFNEQFPDLF